LGTVSWIILVQKAVTCLYISTIGLGPKTPGGASKLSYSDLIFWSGIIKSHTFQCKILIGLAFPFLWRFLFCCSLQKWNYGLVSKNFRFISVFFFSFLYFGLLSNNFPSALYLVPLSWCVSFLTVFYFWYILELSVDGGVSWSNCALRCVLCDGNSQLLCFKIFSSVPGNFSHVLRIELTVSEPLQYSNEKKYPFIIWFFLL